MHIDFTTRSKLDAKSKKCFFVGYGDIEFGYHLWDDQNRKIIRSKDVVFNEAILYKDRGSSFKAKKPKVIPLKNFPAIEDENSRTEDQKTKALEEIKSTPIVELRRSSRIPRPPQRYSPA